MKKIDLQEIQEKIAENPRVLGGIAIAILLSILYVFNKSEEGQKIVYKSEPSSKFENGRVIGATDNVYQRKNEVLRGKLNEIEKQITKVAESFKKQSLYFDERLAELEKEVAEKQESRADGSLAQAPVSPMAPVNAIGNKQPSLNGSSSSETLPPRIGRPYQKLPKLERKGPATISFPATGSQTKKLETITLPSGSFVKAKNITGVEAPEGKALPVLMQLDYAFIGPNRSKIDLSGCFMIAKSMGNLSIERAEIQATKLSCVSRSGRSFEREINGFVADNKDNSFGMIGEVSSKQDNAAAMAFLSSIVEGVGGAIAQAQMTQTTNGMGGSSAVLTGDQGKFLAASGASNAASTVTQWYLKHAQNLLPTINIGSGMDAWIVMQDSVDLPNWYFKKPPTTIDQNFSFLSRFAE